ncbi:gamma-glutamyltransferase [Psychromonas sp. L1A2]|uniref:gamma-glutamyltransferase n=1 Tax=Psychromonas sp. L1A2 TaxID=2686356 RepID=UPI00135A6769|nr:gamma-glutamyltransferase [Psychromonas sp. L1A2]
MMKRKLSRIFLATSAVMMLASCNDSDETSVEASVNCEIDQANPECASGFEERSAVIANDYMAVTNNPLATDAAYDVLKDGGNAIDAAIAAQMVLTLVEPQSSGIGGGGFMLYYDADTKNIVHFDGRETAPSAATGDMFYVDGVAPSGYNGFFQRVLGGKSTGVPGTLKMLKKAHDEYGTKVWSDLFTPAISLAEEGFEVSERLEASIEGDAVFCKDSDNTSDFYVDPDANSYFCLTDESGEYTIPLPAGYLLKNQPLADTFKDVANDVELFYTGTYATNIVTKLSQNPIPGILTTDDIANYEAVKNEPVCSVYRGYTVCGTPPPSSGGITVAQILGILENHDMSQWLPTDIDLNGGQPTANGIHWFSEAARLAYADRGLYIADTDFVALPGGSWESMIDPTYLTERFSLIDAQSSMGPAEAGKPAGAENWSPDQSPNLPSTTHMSIVDKEGNVVSMTSSIETGFGSHQMVDGYLLNNQLTDFSTEYQSADGTLIANRVEGGKRPRSSMAPTIVLDADGQFFMATGSPGGSTIITYVAKTLVGVLDWGLDAQQATSLVNFGSTNGSTFIEEERLTDEATIVSELEAMNHTVDVTSRVSGIATIVSDNDVFVGGADPRREGVAKGE